jgi:hypothetical protein
MVRVRRADGVIGERDQVEIRLPVIAARRSGWSRRSRVSHRWRGRSVRRVCGRGVIVVIIGVVITAVIRVSVAIVGPTDSESKTPAAISPSAIAAVISAIAAAIAAVVSATASAESANASATATAAESATTAASGVASTAMAASTMLAHQGKGKKGRKKKSRSKEFHLQVPL